MTEVVRDVIKEVQTNKQNVYEKTSEDLREDVTKKVVPYAEQVQRLTLPGPEARPPKW